MMPSELGLTQLLPATVASPVPCCRWCSGHISWDAVREHWRHDVTDAQHCQVSIVAREMYQDVW